jgi:hypothetical protein
MAKDKAVTENTIVFNNLVNTIEDWNDKLGSARWRKLAQSFLLTKIPMNEKTVLKYFY